MIILNHSAKNFRNINEISFEPHPEMNIIYGENGQGKTNIIESIWMLTGFYSFRAKKNFQLIKQGESEAEIEVDFWSQEREQNAQMKINKQKELILNGVKEKSPRAIIGKFYSVVFSPKTLSIIQDGPSERRKMLDVALSLIKPKYAIIMSRYLRAVDQRNALLKKYAERKFDTMYFETWDKEIIELGSKIVRYRLDYIKKLSEISEDIYKGISSDREKFSFYYDFSKEEMSDDEIKNKLTEDMEKSRDSDFRRLYTNSGPHTHDLILNLDDKDVRVFGSQGQQRSCALSLKLGEASVIEKITGECPAVLLDDVMSELDEGRQSFILNYLDKWQVFITCCDPSQLLRSKKGKAFEIINGSIKSI